MPGSAHPSKFERGGFTCKTVLNQLLFVEICFGCIDHCVYYVTQDTRFRIQNGKVKSGVKNGENGGKAVQSSNSLQKLNQKESNQMRRVYQQRGQCAATDPSTLVDLTTPPQRFWSRAWEVLTQLALKSAYMAFSGFSCRRLNFQWQLSYVVWATKVLPNSKINNQPRIGLDYVVDSTFPQRSTPKLGNNTSATLVARATPKKTMTTKKEKQKQKQQRQRRDSRLLVVCLNQDSGIQTNK